MILDCAIIGGGAAGLSAATYLARFLRRVLVIDAGESRLHQIPRARNVPGFPEGISGGDLHERLARQARKYGAKIERGLVEHLERTDRGFTVRYRGESIGARTILLATGVRLEEPPINDLAEAVARGIVRYCPICDGFEAQGKRIAVLAGRRQSLEEARFLRTYSDQVVFLPARTDVKLNDREANIAALEGIEIARAAARVLRFDEAGISVDLEGGGQLRFDCVYPCLGGEIQSGLAVALGLSTTADGAIVSDQHQRTDLPGLYVAGDVVKGLDQIASAFGQSAIAATAIHNDLRARWAAEIQGLPG